MAGTPFRYRHSRRKWARRGRAVADFTLGALVAGAEHVAAALLTIIRRGISGIGAALNKMPPTHSEKNLSRHYPAAAEDIQANQFEPLKGAKPGVRFTDIVGLDEAKQAINLRMILPFRHPERAARYGIRRGGGLLLYGPPGTGKTMLAKAIATELDASFFHIRPSDILSEQVGQAETNVARLFETLRGEEKAVLFIDEIEALVPSRRKNGSTIMQRVISQILGEVDGLMPRGPLNALMFIGATNEAEMIDRAMLRPGRFDIKIYVGPPQADARRRLLSLYLQTLPTADDINLDILVKESDGMSCADLKRAVECASEDVFLRVVAQGTTSIPLTLADLLGAVSVVRKQNYMVGSAGRQVMA